LFFRLLYHQFAWTYDLVAWIVSAGNWQAWGLTLLDDLESGRVLELGFGTGHLQIALLKKGISAIGLDASRQMASIALERISRLGFNPLLVYGYAQKIPLQNACCDHAIASFPTNYILDPLTLSEVYRVLKPGGTFLVLPLARPAGDTLLMHALTWLFRITGQAPGQTPEGVQDELQSVYLDLFNQAGFQTSLSYRKATSGELWVIKAIKPA
jgi:ubiquinone/menaquinone biosynthesis C-methylase UbiE